MEDKRVNTETFRSYVLGVMAAFLYGSTLFAPFFGAPLQASWTRGGFRGYLTSLGTALVCLSGWMLWQYRKLSFGVVDFLLAMSIPVALAAAIALVNSKRIASWPLVFRTLAGGGLVSAVLVPYIFSMYKNAGVEAYLRMVIEQLTTSMGAVEGEGMDIAIMKSILNPETILNMTRRIIADTFVAVLFVITFLGHWIGTRIAGRDASRATALPRLEEFYVPAGLIWPFLAGWALVLVSRTPALQALQGRQGIESVAWNLALVVSFCYAAQGLGILRHILGRLSPNGFLRWLGTLLVVLLLFNYVTGAWAAGVLTVFGATETWIPYRISKGVQT